MRKLKLEIQISLDGYLADAAGKTDWMTWNWGSPWTWDGALQQFHTALTQSVDHFFISRQMAVEGFNAHWKNTASDRDDPRYEFANHVVNSRKTVFSRTLDKLQEIPGGWDHCDLVGADYVSYIHKLKVQGGKDLMVYGGGTLVSSLIEANLIDEFFFLVNPVAIGRGMSIFQDRTSLKLVDAKPFSCGVVLLHYQR